MKKHPKAGFSLLELVVAISILAVLAGVMVPQVVQYINRSRLQSVVEDMRVIESATVQYFADVGSLTPLKDIGGFTKAKNGPAFRHYIAGDGQKNWDGPYLQQIKETSPFGGQWDIDVFNHKQGSIDLGTKSQLGDRYAEVLKYVDDTLDGDGDVNRGTVWGDSNGIHFGINYFKP